MRANGNGADDRACGDRTPDTRPDERPRISGDVHGTAVQAGTIHGDIHVHAGGGRERTPRQLPPRPAGFTNRDEELDQLDDVDSEAEGPQRRLMVLTGTGGVGKTALATFYLHRVMSDFPDGQLYVDLAGFSPAATVEPAQALEGFLRALGVAPAEIPQQPAARLALFKEHTQQRRMAVLLDNAATAAQVRSLLPGTGGHLVVVTTRSHLAALVTEGAEFVHVQPLQPAAAADLLHGLVTRQHGVIGTHVAHQLAELAGRLPLALCAVAGRLLLRPAGSAERVVAELDDERRRMSGLSRDAELSVRAVFDVSHATLPSGPAHLYRLLGLHPGRDFDAAAGAALAGTDIVTAEEHLEHLVAANLLSEPTSGRYAFHDLVRIHARDRAHTEEPAPAREAALDRLIKHYLATAVAADLRLNPGRWHLNPMFDEARQAEPVFADRDAALSWLETELPTLGALVGLCHDTGRHQQCWHLCEALWMLFLLRKHFDAWLQTHHTGLAAARTLDDPAAQARMLTALGAAHQNLDDLDTATEEHRRAHDLWRHAVHPRGEAVSLEGLGVIALRRAQPGEAIPRFTAALAIYAEHDDARGHALMHRRLGEANRDLGAHETAIDHFTRAHDHFTAIGDDYLTGRTLVGLATGYLATGRLDDARTALTDARRANERVGARLEIGRVHALLGELEQLRGQTNDARDHLRRAHAIYTSLGYPAAETIQRQLAELEDDEGAPS